MKPRNRRALSAAWVAALFAVAFLIGYAVVPGPSRTPPTATALPQQAHGKRGVGSRLSSPQDTTPEPPSPALSLGRELKAKHDLHHAEFVTLQETKTRRFLGRSIDTTGDGAEPREKIFRLRRSTQYAGSYTLKGCTRMYLTCELNDRITVDRQWARSFEQWHLHFDKDGAVRLQSRRNSRYLAVLRDGRSLIATTTHRHEAATWALRAAVGCGSEAECWGADHRFDDAHGVAERDLLTANVTFPLVTSPKPLPQLQPLHPDDPYDGVTNARRTLRNWASIPGMVPVVLTQDPNYRTVAAEQNALRRDRPRDGDGSAQCGHVLLQDVATDGAYEVQRKFDQPTYRGLFRRALKLFPDAPAVMFSNGDILYTTTLTQTLRSVLHYVEVERRKAVREGRPAKSRWMVVGQRVNRDVKPQWTLRDSERVDGKCPATPQWAHEMEGLAKSGDLFQSNAEDYFIVSRDMFDWREIPDFVLGGVAFDNWITHRGVKAALDGEAIMVDASKTITALHQNHNRNSKASHLTDKSIYNLHLARHGSMTFGHTADAPTATERRRDGTVAIFEKHKLLFD